ncbi:MAG: hypothetical protein GY778_16280 [bacterium]|nr:hypothetical protein [bacterium]
MMETAEQMYEEIQLHNMDGDPSFLACRFMGNWVPLGDPGGGFYSFSGSPTLTNCAFSGNDAGQGGAMHVHGGIATVTNCVLSQNTANTAGGIQYAGTETMVIANSILWGNSDNSGTGEAAQLLVSSGAVVVDYTCVEGWTGGLGGTGNLGDDPMLADPNGPDGWVGTVDDDLHLLPGSSCIDAGNNAAVPLEVLTDLDGAPRFADDAATADTGSGTPPIVDLGPYEYGALFGDFDGDGDVDEVDYSFFDICFEGPDWPPFFQECALFDFDSDNDVDLDDFGGFQSYYTGS